MANLLHEELDNTRFSDDESLSGRYGESAQLQAAPEVKGWDMFRELPPEADRSLEKSEARMLTVLRIVKAIVILLVFFFVLGGAVVAKGTALFMTSQLRRDQRVQYCNRQLDLTGEKTFVAEVPEAERVSWAWVLLFALLVPELGTLIRSTRICFFKSWRRPSRLDLTVVLIFETCHVLGIGLLAFAVLPDLDVVKGAMLTNCVCFIPAVLGLMSEEGRERQEKGSVGRRTVLRMILDTIAMSAQATGFVVWPLVEPHRSTLWLIPPAILLTSFGWWENYVTANSSFPPLRALGDIKQRMKKTRYFISIFSSMWRALLLFIILLVSWHLRGGHVGDLFSLFSTGFSEHDIRVMEIRPLISTLSPEINEPLPTEDVYLVAAQYHAPLWVLLVQILAAYFAYVVGKYACRIMVQGFSYALPVTLAVPITISLLIVFCGMKNADPCAFSGSIPDYLFFRSPPIFFLSEFVAKQHAWIWLLWFGSQVWLTLHIWKPKCERLASTEKLFVSPMYSALLVDQSLALNRRIDDQADMRSEEVLHPTKNKDPDMLDNMSIPSSDGSRGMPYGNVVGGYGAKSTDSVTRIFACATMWHETKDEMMEILKSIVRMDEDQSARRVAQKYLQVTDPDYYEFETHIFFDDAYVPCGPNPDDGSVANSFVKQLINTIDEAASHVHETHVRLRPPKKFPTPYGGKLVWSLPGKTKIYVHLKDKTKIRHKKRWSQVMYMYYLLGHRLMELPIPAERKEVIAENTYLLALDGDIDFQPKSVQLLVDLMKKNRVLGAACGRIHPVGSGAMVWYQKFEYAIGHWLQKATEHMIGCVLCSPGCFSLFRGKALMDDNVMRKYTTRSEEALHYVQYDQGEDRWLCTLLLQRGYRVEYSAAADAYTHCPEGFHEFYNQRRRWVPSTMANIMDLLGDYKRTIKVNDNVSVLYMAYQTLLLGGSVLGPGTILLMLVGAFVAAFKVDQWTSFAYNIVPILFFMIICYFTKAKTQLTMAMIISTIYGMVMIAVLVGIMMQISQDGPLAPSSLFFFITAAQFIVTAMLHPREFGCLPFGVVYYITVPSMYMLLIIYSLFNLNNVSWGTREVPQVQQKLSEEEAAKAATEAGGNKKKSGAIMNFLQGLRTRASQVHEDEGSIEFSLAGLFKVMCCTYPKTVDEKQQLLRIADTLEVMNRRMEGIERSIDPTPLGSRRRSFSILRAATAGVGAGSSGQPLTALAEVPAEAEEDLGSDSETSTLPEPKQERDDLVNPYWMEDPDLKKGEVDFINSEEEQFWKDVIDKYLYPLDQNKKEQLRISKDLKTLRDKTVFGFFMLNAMFVMVLFLIQLNKDILHLNWPLGIKSNITFNKVTEEIGIDRDYLQLEPIGMVFLVSFALIMIIQFIAMLFHRFGTLSHILAATELNWYCTKNVEDISTDALIDRHAVEIARQLQKIKGLEDEDEAAVGDNDGKGGGRRHSSGAGGKRRFTLIKLEQSSQKQQNVRNHVDAFEKRFLSISADVDGVNAPIIPCLMKRRDTAEAITVRRNSVLNLERRRSTLRMRDSIIKEASSSEDEEHVGEPLGVSNPGVNLRLGTGRRVTIADNNRRDTIVSEA